MARCNAARDAKGRLIPVGFSLVCLLTLGGCFYYGDAGYGYGYDPGYQSHYRPYHGHHHHHGGKHRHHDDAPRAYRPGSPIGKDLGSAMRRFQRPR